MGMLVSPPRLPGVFRDTTAARPISPNPSVAIPSAVAKDAVQTAARLFPKDASAREEFREQLLAAYTLTWDKDVLIIFNPGGWGYAPISTSPGWGTILAGMTAELASRGYSSIALDYQRSTKSRRGQFSEFQASTGASAVKAGELAERTMFLTRSLPQLYVILTGESNGCVTADTALKLAKSDTGRILAIETGPPAWYKNGASDRALVLRSNGTVPDAFSNGDLGAILRANIAALFGKSAAAPGKVLLYIGAPGHEYSWGHPAVGDQVTAFIDSHFVPRATTGLSSPGGG